MRPKIHDTHALSIDDPNPARSQIGTGFSNRKTAAEESFERNRILEEARHPKTITEEQLLAEFV